MASRLEKHLLRAKSKTENSGLFALYPFYLFLSAVWLPHDQLFEETVSLTQCKSLHFGYLFLAQRWLGGFGSLHLIHCPVDFNHNAITHLATHPKLQKIVSPDMHPVSPKCGNSPNTQNSYSLILWWPLGLHNISLDVKFRVQNFSFCW